MINGIKTLEVTMSRNTVEFKVIDGKRYFTANYFSKEVGVSERRARKYLEDFQHKTDSKSPKLYSEKIMQKAIDSAMAGKPGLNAQERILKKLREQEEKRIGEEEALYDSFLEREEAINSNDFEEENIKRSQAIALKKYREDLTNMMLKHLLAIQGFAFDDEQYLDDLILHESEEAFRPEGGRRSDEHLKAVKRLTSTHAYLKKI